MRSAVPRALPELSPPCDEIGAKGLLRGMSLM